jgi:hypothetical protein
MHPRRRVWFAAVLPLVLFSAGARAESAQTFVASNGDDGAPCTRSEPCRTLQAAYAATSALGTVVVLDPGSFGALTITHSVTIDGRGVGALLAPAGNGITIDAGSGDTVEIDGLTIDGQGVSQGDGIRVDSVGALVVARSTVRNFLGNGVSDHEVHSGQSSGRRQHKSYLDTTVSGNGGFGVSVGSIQNPIGPLLAVELKGVNLVGNRGGGFLLATSEPGAAAAEDSIDRLAKTYNSSHSNTAHLVDCLVSGNGGVGIEAYDATSGAFVHSAIFVDGSSVFQNDGTGLVANGSGAAITLSGMNVYANTVGLASLGGGQLLSFGNNRVLENATNGAATALVTQK